MHLCDAIRAVFLVQMDDYLGIGIRLERVPTLTKAISKLYEIVNFAVERYPDRLVLVRERRNGACRQVDNRETPLSQPYSRRRVDALTIGAAMNDRVTHSRHSLTVDGRTVELNFSADTAHTPSRE